MKEISELKAILGQYLLWSKALIDCFARMLLSMFITRTVNLSETAEKLPCLLPIVLAYFC